MACRIIGIAGASGSGKTTLARRIQGWLGANHSDILSMDDYYVDRLRRRVDNWDDPESLDIDRLCWDVSLLRCGYTIERPVYSFTTGHRVGHVEMAPPKVLIIKGLWALYWESLRHLMALKIFVDTPLDVCRVRRLLRDIHRTGRSPEEILADIEEWAVPGYYTFVLPTRQYADICWAGQSWSC